MLNPEQPVLASHDILDRFRAAAGGVVWRYDRRGSLLVVLVRHAHDGVWGFPKGRLRRRETARAAALREVREETGLRCRCEGLVGSLAYRSTGGASRIATYWFMRRREGGLRVSDEISAVRWVSLDEATGLLADRPEASLLPSIGEAFSAREAAAE